MNPVAFFGEFQSTLCVGRQCFLGIGATHQESRRMAIEAADIKLAERLPPGCHHIVTEWIGFQPRKSAIDELTQLSQEAGIYD